MKDIHLINFTELSLEEKKTILKWRNNPNIRKWMQGNKKITLEEHLNFIDSLKIKEDKVYFLVRNDTQDIGIVDLTNIIPKISAELGIYSHPELKGYGSLLMDSIISYTFNILKLKQLYANVLIDNKRAINLYKKFNFKILNKIENKKMYRMELKYENS